MSTSETDLTGLTSTSVGYGLGADPGAIARTTSTGLDTTTTRVTAQSTPLVTLTGNNQANVFNTSNRAARFRIFARGGNDRVVLGSNSVAYGELGNDLLDGRQGGGGNRLLGGAGADQLYAKTGDVLLGGAGADQLWAGLGGNRLTGGLGNDRFWLATGQFPQSANIVTDFNGAQDRLVIQNLRGVFSFANLTLTAVNGNTRIQAGGRNIALIRNRLPGQLQSRHFIIRSLASPSITSQLTVDTGESASDQITQDPRISGQVNGPQISRFTAQINGGAVADLTAAIQSDRTFSLSRSDLETIHGSSLEDGAYTIQFQAVNTQGRTVNRALTFTLDSTPIEVSSVDAPDATIFGETTHRFTVTFSDNVAVDVASLGNGDVLVTGPNDFSQAATLVQVDTNADGTPRTATYEITPPNGAWALGDNGLYQVTLVAGQISDVAGNLNAGAVNIGSFSANIPLTPTVSVGLANDTGRSGSDRLTNDASLTGQIAGAAITQIQIQIDGGAFVNFTEPLAPNGSFTLSAAQLATYNGGPLSQGSHTVTFRATNDSGSVENSITFDLDTTLGSASATAPNVTAVTNTPTVHTVTVDYADAGAIAIDSLGTGDIRVTGPNGFSQLATFVSVTPNSDGTPRTATYQITVPGNTWNAADNGTYTIALVADEVQDLAGNAIAAGNVGSFDVAIPALPTVAVGLANDTGRSGSDRLTNDASLSGQIGGTNITQIQIQIDGGAFVDFTEPLTTNGGFTLSAAQLATYNGGPLAQGSHTVTFRATNGGGSVEESLTFTLDTTLGSATATAANVVTATNTPTVYTFTVNYADAGAIAIDSLGTGDIRVTGPNGFSQLATFVSVTPNGDGTPRAATYQITVPGTTWNTYDNGAYTLALVADEVQDVAGNAIAAGTVGTFDVTIPFVAQRINFQPVAVATPSGYQVDSGQGFDAARGYGWVVQGSNTALNIANRVFDRDGQLSGAAVDQRLDTVALMQSAGGDAAAWEFALANGRYSVTVSVGDTAGSTNNVIRAEGQTIVSGFTPGGPRTFKLATLSVEVTDGFLTLDAVGGTDTRLNFVEIVPVAPGAHPQVLTSVLDNAVNVNRRAAINLSDLSLIGVGQGVDATTLTAANVQLYRTRDGAPVLSNLNTSGGADTIIVQPASALAANTQYTLRITDGVKDLGGVSFLPYSLTFTTGNELTPPTDGVSFEQSLVFDGAPLASLEMSPDSQYLYATALDGVLRRWQVQPDGSLTGLQTFSGLISNPSRPPELIGIAFDPTNSNVIWVTQNTRTATTDAEDFTSKIVKITLTGGTAAFTGVVQDYVVGLPRSGRDHFTNSLRFGPDNKLYVTQGSNTSAGGPDLPWGMRPERLLTAAMLQIDPTLTPPPGGFNVQTENYTRANGTVIPGNYDPFAPDAPVKIYATGIRNAYDFVFHSNQTLYVPVNGSGAGGIALDDPNTPADESLTSVGSRPDYLLKVEQGSYHGHPNASRGEYIMFGGNPTADPDPDEIVGTLGVSGYAVGTMPEPNYRPALRNLGSSRAPTGVIEYRSNSFGGRLQGRLLFTEYSSGDNIMLLDLDASGNVTASSILAGGSVNPDWGMANPVDLIENTTNGHIYVAELYPTGFGAGNTPGRIRVLRPTAAG